MTDFNKILDKAKELEIKMRESQDKIKKIKAVGISGSNSVKVTLDGDGEMQKIELSEEVIKEEKSKQSSFGEILDSERKSENLNQIGNHFIAIPNKEGLLLIHQRRAHKRILFEYFRKNISENKGQSQQLLFPKEIKFITSEELHVHERENAAVKKFGAIFIIGIGWPMKDGTAEEEVSLCLLLIYFIFFSKDTNVSIR